MKRILSRDATKPAAAEPRTQLISISLRTCPTSRPTLIYERFSVQLALVALGKRVNKRELAGRQAYRHTSLISTIRESVWASLFELDIPLATQSTQCRENSRTTVPVFAPHQAMQPSSRKCLAQASLTPKLPQAPEAAPQSWVCSTSSLHLDQRKHSHHQPRRLQGVFLIFSVCVPH